MKLHYMVCTVEQATPLKELGVSQTAFFSWFVATDIDDDPGLNRASGHCPVCCHPTPPYIQELSAFTVAELGQMLPRYYPSWRCLEEGGHHEFWIATVIGQPEGYDREKADVYDIRTVAAFDRYGKTQAEALAELLISLLETGAEKVEDINKRLNS